MNRQSFHPTQKKTILLVGANFINKVRMSFLTYSGAWLACVTCVGDVQLASFSGLVGAITEGLGEAGSGIL